MSIFLRYSSCLLFRPRLSKYSMLSPALRALATSANVDTIAGVGHGPSRTLSSKSQIAGGSRRRRTTRSLEKKPSEKVSGVNILEETKVQEYLELIASTSHEVTLIDIERHRPPKRVSSGSPEYEERYNALIEKLCRSFSTTQFRQFLAMYQLSAPHRSTKWELASLIIERRWNWPSLKAIKKQKRDWTEVAYESFPLDARQSFLILGKDGAHLLDLSSEFNVHVSFSVNPLCLKIEGLRGSIDNFRRHIEEFKTGIQEEIFELPPGGNIELGSLHHISRLSGVFLESTGQGSIRISHRNGDSDAVHFAKRLTLHKTFEATEKMATLVHSAQTGTLLPKTAAQPTYSLYPFYSSSFESRVFNAGHAFRIRRTRDWLSSHLSNGLKHTRSISDNGSIVDVDGALVDLRARLLDQLVHLQEETNAKPHVSASFGHLLVCSRASQNIFPPLKGAIELSYVLDWLQSNENDRIFVPSLPPLLINGMFKRQRLMHRLVYRSLTHNRVRPSQVLQFEVLHFDAHMPKANDKNWELLLDRLDNPTRKSQLIDESTALEWKCWVESASHLNIMMPDRPIDVQLSISSCRVLSQERWPKSIENYFNQLRSFLTGATFECLTPAIPLTLSHDGVTYRLESASNIRQNSGHDNPTLLPSSKTIVETALEQESRQRSRLCKVVCSDIESDDSWNSFVGTCDALTSSVYSDVSRDWTQGGERPFA